MKCEKFIDFEEIIAVSAKSGEKEVQAVKDYVRSSLDRFAESARADSLQGEIEEKLRKLKQSAKESSPILI